MKCCAVVDTNVLVSALLSSHEDAATVQIVGKLFSGEIMPLFSVKIFREYEDVLRRRKFRFSEELVCAFLDALQACGVFVEPARTGETLPDSKDLPFYEVVMDKQNKNAYLVTGNLKHFPHKPFIVTPKELLDILNEA